VDIAEMDPKETEEENVEWMICLKIGFTRSGWLL
jgi:hypothetical protein